MNWENAGIIAATSALVTAVILPLLLRAMRKTGIEMAMRRAAEAQGEARAAVEVARDLVQSRLELRKDLQALAHEVENLKLSQQFQRDWAAEHACAAERGGTRR